MIVLENEERPQVSIIEDNQPFRESLESYLTENGFEVVEVAEDLSHYKFTPVDLLILDIQLPSGHSTHFIEYAIRKAAFMDILILSGKEDEETIFKCMANGAKGYLSKSVDLPKIEQALHTIFKGGVVIEPRLAKRFWELFSGYKPYQKKPFPYTEDDRTIIQFIAKGLSKVEVADVLGLPRRSVKTRLQKMYNDIGINNQVSLVVHALKNGWIDID